jgi:hypothetical protein
MSDSKSMASEEVGTVSPPVSWVRVTSLMREWSGERDERDITSANNEAKKVNERTHKHKLTKSNQGISSHHTLGRSVAVIGRVRDSQTARPEQQE